MIQRNIDIVLRSDALAKDGGDNFQARQYQTFLEADGYDVRCLPFHASMTFRGDSIVHILNVDRPFEFLAAVRMAGSRRIVVSPIHHDLLSVRMMRKAERNQGIRSIIGRILPESGRELIAYMARSAKSIRRGRDAIQLLAATCWAISISRRVWQSVGRALDDVHAVTLLAEGEKRSIMLDTSWLGTNSVLIPNGVPGSELPTMLAWKDRTTDVCVVGRIEPRKRQLDVAVAASQSGLRVTFVGPASPSAGRYVADFESVVAAHSNLEWLGGLERSRVLELMADSRVLLNASWVEVQSLVDIEAASMGCWVVVGRGGNSEEWLPNNVVSVDSYEVPKVVSVVHEILSHQVGPQLATYSYTWKKAADVLAQVYAGLPGMTEDSLSL